MQTDVYSINIIAKKQLSSYIFEEKITGSTILFLNLQSLA